MKKCEFDSLFKGLKEARRLRPTGKLKGARFAFPAPSMQLPSVRKRA